MIGLLRTDSPFQVNGIEENDVIDLDMCIGKTHVTGVFAGHEYQVEIPEGHRYIQLIKVDGKVKAVPMRQNILIGA